MTEELRAQLRARSAKCFDFDGRGMDGGGTGKLGNEEEVLFILEKSLPAY